MAMEISLFTLRELPAAQFGLPFLLIFALVYGALTSAGTFKENRAVNVLISLVISFFAITYEPLITGIWDNMPLLVGLLFVVFIAVIVKRAISGVKFGKKKEAGSPSPEKFLAFIVISIVALLIIGGFREPVRKALDMEQDAANSLFFIIGIIFFIILVWAALKYWSEASRAATEKRVARAIMEEAAKKAAAQKQQQQEN